MDVSLDEEESAAVRQALRRYVSELRMEIVDTDNPGYKRNLREERAVLERAIEKLDASLTARPGDDAGAVPRPGHVVERVVRIWWETDSGS